MTALRTTVIGSYPFPGWLEYAADHLDDFGADDVSELQEDAVIAAVHDQVAAGLDAVSDGEQTRLDFNLGFYGCLEGIEQGSSPRLLGPPAHDQRPRHRDRRRAFGSQRPRHRRGVRAAAPGRASGPDAEGRRAGAVHPRRQARGRPLGDGRSAPADRPGGARRAGRCRLRGDRDRRAFDELLRAPRGSGTARRALQPHGDARRRPRAALDAPLLRQLQGPRGRAATVRPALPRLSRGRRGRDPSRDGEPRAGRGGDRRHDRGREGRRRRRDRRQELLRRDAGRRRRLGSGTSSSSRRRSGSRSRPIAGSARRRAGRRRRSCRTSSKASGSSGRSSDL